MKLSLTIEYDVEIPATKLDVMRARRDALRKASDAIVREMQGMAVTEFSGNCSKCGEPLLSEYGFARHFVISANDLRWGYLNLGECPNGKA